MHINLIDAPSDIYGAVSSVSRPLVHALNEATMHRSTFDALVALLAWAGTQVDAVKEALDEHSLLEAEQHQRDKSPVQRDEAPVDVPVIVPTDEAPVDVPVIVPTDEAPVDVPVIVPTDEAPVDSTVSTPESITPVIEMSIKPLAKRASNKPKA